MPLPGKTPEQMQALRLRQLDLLQRFYLGGQLQHVYTLADELLHAKWIEPVAGCLGGYLMLRLARPQDLNVASYNMARYFDALSDSHLLMAEFMASQGTSEQAFAHYVTALDRGLPICADGLTRLFAGAKAHGIQHPRLPLLNRVYENHVPGLLWTAWTPKALVPGGRLDE
jgi:hypothetical protein